MSEPFIGEIRLVGFNFAPVGWAFCDGSVVPIDQNSTLFALIGTTYGGDGQQTFALPNLLGRTPIHFNSSFPLSSLGGLESVILTTPQLPQHSHPLAASTAPATTTAASGNLLSGSAATVYVAPTAVAATGAVTTLTGSNQPHDNMAPYLCVNFVISLFGVFPSQN